jgi:hypothetical protein
MTNSYKCFLASAIVALTPALASAQGSNSQLICVVDAAALPELRPEGYTELIGDIIIMCTGGQSLQVGTTIPTADIVVTISPLVPITSRLLGTDGSSEIMLLIDEPGSGIYTPATGPYGPQAPQSLCTSDQQVANGGIACAAQVGLDTSLQYQVAVVPGTSTAARNVYQGKIGDSGVNTVSFYNVPVLPPSPGTQRYFRITNTRVPLMGTGITNQVQATVSSSGNSPLPLQNNAIIIGIQGPMGGIVNAAPPGSGNPFAACFPVASPTLAARVTFTEGFATAFKTRVVPLTNTPWASTAQNNGTPGQNIPGGMYEGYVLNNESEFIFPAAAFTGSNNVTYTAGLADYGTRVKAVFQSVPAGVTLYVSTTSAASYDTPGGTNIVPYAVLVGAAQSDEANNDGAAITPLAATAIGSDGLGAYPLTADSFGNLAAIWEVVNANPFSIDSLTFSVYLAHSTIDIINGPYIASLTFSPEPGGGTFPAANAATALTGPVPRFGVYQALRGAWAEFNLCPLSTNAPSTVPFSYTTGGIAPAAQTFTVSATPSNPTIAVSPSTSSGGNWLSASLSGTTLSVSAKPTGLNASGVSAKPTGLTASATAYAGNVTLSSPGYATANVLVSFTVSPSAQLAIATSHSGDFMQGQLSQTYTVTVSNGASGGPTSGTVTVTEMPPSGETLVSMTGASNVWTCAGNNCTATASLPAGGSYSPITVTVDVSPSAASQITNVATASGGASSTSPSYGDATTVDAFNCIVTGGQTPGIADVRQFIDEALGIAPPAYALTSAGGVGVADVQVVLSAAVTGNCKY